MALTTNTKRPEGTQHSISSEKGGDAHVGDLDQSAIDILAIHALNRDTNYFVSLKHRLESERDLMVNTPPDNVVVLSHEDERILATRLDRNGIRLMPCDESIIKMALSVFDDLSARRNTNGIRHTEFIIFDHGEAFVAAVAWDDSPKVSMVIFADEIVVLDEQM